MIKFDDTEIAFNSNDDNDLRRAYFLFRTIAHPSLVKLSKWLIRTARLLHVSVSWAVKPTIYQHFVGGENLTECYPLVRKLEKYKVQAILDYSVEGGSDEAFINQTIQEILATIDLAAADPNIPFAVFKPTALCDVAVLEKASLKIGMTDHDRQAAQKFKERMTLLCRRAADKKVSIMIDAEDSWYQDYIDEVVNEMMELFNKETAIVYNTLQMYHLDRLGYLQQCYERALQRQYFLGIKFVRGAYMEKERYRASVKGYPSPIQPDKEATDHSYNEGLRFAVEHLDRVFIFNGTHNETSNRLLAELMESKGLARNDRRCFFSQLYGMSDHITFTLASQGYNVAKYIPYGPVAAVLPYLIRRAEENTAIAGQSNRELLLIQQEMKRRRSQKGQPPRNATP